MLNYIWAFMVLAGIVYGSLTGNIDAVGNGALEASKEAVTLCMTMLGVMALWMGVMEIAKKAGLIESLSRGCAPVVSWLFPRLDRKGKAFEYITTNIIANILGLGWAATPSGLKAMEELSVLNGHRERASNEMCVFLILNISSLQLIPVNIIAYRSQYGSVNPTAIMAPAIVATAVSTVVGIIFCKIMDRRWS